MGRRQLYFGELRRLIFAENIVNAYRTRAKSESWAMWAKANPTMAAILVEVEKTCL